MAIDKEQKPCKTAVVKIALKSSTLWSTTTKRLSSILIYSDTLRNMVEGRGEKKLEGHSKINDARNDPSAFNENLEGKPKQPDNNRPGREIKDWLGLTGSTWKGQAINVHQARLIGKQNLWIQLNICS